jgi:hypothetical protein
MSSTPSTIYVSTSGSDSNAGNFARPFRTVQKAIEFLGSQGGTVVLRGGTYNLNKGIWISGRNGTNPLKIAAYQGERVILDGSNIPNGNVPITVRDAQNIHIRGLEIRNSSSHGIEVIHGQNIRIANNYVHNTDGMGIRVRGYLSSIPGEWDTTKKSANIVIRNNQVEWTNLSNSGANKGQNWGAAIQAMNAHNVTVVGNKIARNFGEGLGMVMVKDGYVRGNTLENNFSVQLYLDNASNTRVQGNFIYEDGNREFWRNNAPAVGIGLANELYQLSAGDRPEQYHLNELKIFNNVVVGGSHSVSYGTWGGIHNGSGYNPKGIKNSILANNTFYGAQYELIKISADSNTRNLEVVNNIVNGRSGQRALAIGDRSGISFRANLWSPGLQEIIAHPNDVQASPRLKSPGGRRYQDYALTSASPAIDAGLRLPELNNLTKPDLGAIEFSTRASARSASLAAGQAFSLNLAPAPARQSAPKASQDQLTGATAGRAITGVAPQDTLVTSAAAPAKVQAPNAEPVTFSSTQTEADVLGNLAPFFSAPQERTSGAESNSADALAIFNPFPFQQDPLVAMLSQSN